MLVAEALAIVRGKRDLPVAGADQFLTEFACHGHAIVDAEFSPESFEQMPAKAMALPALDLPIHEKGGDVTAILDSLDYT